MSERLSAAKLNDKDNGFERGYLCILCQVLTIRLAQSSQDKDAAEKTRLCILELWNVFVNALIADIKHTATNTDGNLNERALFESKYHLKTPVKNVKFHLV